MASMKYCDKHNQVGFLKKPEESAGFAEIVDFLKGSHIRYALTHNPTIHDSLVKQFWQTATASTLADGTLELRATIDTLEYTITEASVRSKLQLADASGISMLPNTEIFEGMGNMGYPADGTFTFWKSHFTPQWRFLVHHILHCMSPKSGGWDQFGSNIATALICLSTGRVYNFSKLIFDGMVANLKSKTKFLMYPRFLQMILEIQTENKHPYLAIVLTKKIFGNMKRGFRGVPRPLLPAMLPVVAVDQSAGPTDQAEDQPSSSAPLPSSSHPPVISATLASEPTPVAEPTTHHSSPSTAPEHETMEHPFEQPSPEHQPSSPRQESDIPQTQAPTHTHEAETGHMSVDDLFQLVPQLMTRIESLEKDLKQTKQTMGNAIVKLVKKVKKMEKVVKSRRVTPKQGKSLGETDISPQGLEAAETLAEALSQIKTKRRNVKTRVRRRLDAEDVSTGFEDVSTGFEDVSTGFTDIKSASEKVSSGGEHVSASQREGKAVLEETPQTKRTKKQIREEQASLAEIARIQAEEEAENARREELKRQDELAAKRLQEELELSEAQKKRMAQVQEDAQFYTEDNWDTIRAKLEANADLVKEIVGEDVSKADYAQRMGRWKLAQIKKLTDEELKEKFKYLMRSMKREDVSDPKEKEKESVKRELEFEIKKPVLRYTKRKYLARKGLQKKPESAKSGTKEDVKAYMEERVDEPSSEEFPMSLLNDLTRDDLKELYRLMMLKYGDNRPEEEFERVLWEDLKTIVHCLTVEAVHIYMLTEVKYLLPPRVCKAMLEKKLLGDRKDEKNVSTCNVVSLNILRDDEASYHEDASENGTATNKPKQQQQQLIPTTTTISNIKLPILKKEEYDIWAMEMEHYLEYIDNDVWKVIQNGNSKKRISTGKDGVVRILPPVSPAEIHAVEKERKARTILLMAIPKEHLRRFHGMDDAKEIWEAIRTRFGGNANSKKMQKAVLKQQFEAFTISSSEGLEKGYDRFQQLLSQLEAHGAEVSTEDANHKFLRSLPPAWSNLAMTMRTKPDVDTLSIDDFTSLILSTSSNNIQEREVPAGFADEVIYSLFAKQSKDLDLLHEDLEQIDDIDIEEMDINWQIAMIAIQMKKFYKKTGRRVRIDGNKPVGFDKKKLECFKCHNTGHFARECPSKGTNDGKKRDFFIKIKELERKSRIKTVC
ncbi:ribonuclease H-like domain-containing protein [Tanacetum coccineum]